MSPGWPADGGAARTPPPADRAAAPRARSLATLRARTLGALHIGRKAPGERLPSVRGLARQLGADHRAVAEVYRDLEAQGLVEIRPRSGVFVGASHRPARPHVDGADAMEELFAVAAAKGVPLPELARLVERYGATRGLRCLCVESNEDAMTAFALDIEQLVGLAVERVYVGDPAAAGTPGRESLHERFVGADIVVTTQYHAHEVRPIVERLGIAFVLVTIAQPIVDLMCDRLRAGTLTIVAADPTFGERIRSMYAEYIYSDDHVRIIAADDADAVAALPADEPVLVTRAARRHVGDHPAQLVTGKSPTISPETVDQLCRAIVNCNRLRQIDPSA